MLIVRNAKRILKLSFCFVSMVIYSSTCGPKPSSRSPSSMSSSTFPCISSLDSNLRANDFFRNGLIFDTQLELIENHCECFEKNGWEKADDLAAYVYFNCGLSNLFLKRYALAKKWFIKAQNVNSKGDIRQETQYYLKLLNEIDEYKKGCQKYEKKTLLIFSRQKEGIKKGYYGLEPLDKLIFCYRKYHILCFEIADISCEQKKYNDLTEQLNQLEKEYPNWKLSIWREELLKLVKQKGEKLDLN